MVGFLAENGEEKFCKNLAKFSNFFGIKCTPIYSGWKTFHNCKLTLKEATFCTKSMLRWPAMKGVESSKNSFQAFLCIYDAIIKKVMMSSKLRARLPCFIKKQSILVQHRYFNTVFN